MITFLIKTSNLKEIKTCEKSTFWFTGKKFLRRYILDGYLKKDLVIRLDEDTPSK